MTTKPDLPIVPFASRDAWEAFLEGQHATSEGLWLKIAKKGSRIESVTYDQAVEVALCYGWIDGQARKFDEDYWLQRFTPRRPRSKWSKVNRQRAMDLVKRGKMKAAGLREVERAKADGRWDAAYDAPSTATVPDDLRSAGEERVGSGVLRHAQQGESLRDPVPDPGRQETRDSGATYREVCGDAARREEDLPLKVCLGWLGVRWVAALALIHLSAWRRGVVGSSSARGCVGTSSEVEI